MDIEPETAPGPLTSPSPEPPADTTDEEAQVQRDAARFLQFLQANPAAKAYIDRTLRQHLQNGVDVETWGNIRDGLILYAGEDIARFVLMVLLSADDLLGPEKAGYLALVEKNADPEVWSYLRGLLAIYSAGVKESYGLAGEHPQAWRVVNRRVFYDEITERWQATFEIIKYNGERLYLEETPTSAIVLCNAILDALNSVPVEKAQQAADRNVVEELVRLLYTLVERFAPDLLEGEEEEPVEV